MANKKEAECVAFIEKIIAAGKIKTFCHKCGYDGHVDGNCFYCFKCTKLFSAFEACQKCGQKRGAERPPAYNYINSILARYKKLSNGHTTLPEEDRKNQAAFESGLSVVSDKKEYKVKSFVEKAQEKKAAGLAKVYKPKKFDKLDSF